MTWEPAYVTSSSLHTHANTSTQCAACCCPFFLAGRNHQRLQDFPRETPEHWDECNSTCCVAFGLFCCSCGFVPAYLERNMVRMKFGIQGNDFSDCMVRFALPPWAARLIFYFSSRSITDLGIAGCVLLHTVYFGSDKLGAEEASKGRKGYLAATVPVCKAGNGLRASSKPENAPATSRAANERAATPSVACACPLAASNNLADSAKSSSALC